MPKKGGKSKKRSEQYTPRDDEVNNDIQDVKEEPTVTPGEPEPVQVEAAPVVEEKKEEEPIIKEEAPSRKAQAPKEDSDDSDLIPFIAPAHEIIDETAAEPEPVPVAPKVEAPKVESPKKEEPKDEQSSGFVVVKEEQTKQKEVEIKPNHVERKTAPAPIAPVGIKGIKRDIHPEINSPFRRQKTSGGLKLSLVQEPDSPIHEDPKEQEDHRFDAITPQWDIVLANLHISKAMFEDLKQATREEHIRMYREGQLASYVQERSAALELKMPEGTTIDHETLAQFNVHAKETYDEITNFIHILQDWVDSKMHKLEEEVPADQLRRQIIKEEVIEPEDEDIDHILEAEKMGISSKNPEELKGLVREASIRLEKGEPAVIKKQASSKSQKRSEAKEGKKDEPSNEEEESSSMMPKIVIGAALAVLAGSYYFKYLKK